LGLRAYLLAIAPPTTLHCASIKKAGHLSGFSALLFFLSCCRAARYIRRQGDIFVSTIVPLHAARQDDKINLCRKLRAAFLAALRTLVRVWLLRDSLPSCRTQIFLRQISKGQMTEMIYPKGRVKDFEENFVRDMLGSKFMSSVSDAAAFILASGLARAVNDDLLPLCSKLSLYSQEDLLMGAQALDNDSMDGLLKSNPPKRRSLAE
jgi:hypothetical protein